MLIPRPIAGLNPALASIPIVLVLAGAVGFYLMVDDVDGTAVDETTGGGTQITDTSQPDDVSKPKDDSPGAKSNDTPPAEDKDSKEAARITKLLAGTWTRDSYGNRRLTIREDGTASMVIKPSTVYALVFGDRIDIEVKWELQDGYVDYKVTSATPAEKFEMAKKTWGDHWHEKIHKLDEKTLILLGEEGDEYEWTRVEGNSDR
jgi:hypothetical protein